MIINQYHVKKKDKRFSETYFSTKNLKEFKRKKIEKEKESVMLR